MSQARRPLSPSRSRMRWTARRFASGITNYSRDLLHRGSVEHGIRPGSLQAYVIVLQHLQLSRFGNLQALLDLPL